MLDVIIFVLIGTVIGWVLHEGVNTFEEWQEDRQEL